MTLRRDWQLQQLGITQWTLRRPAVLRGEVAVVVPAHARLLLVADPLPPHDHPLIADVVRSMDLEPEQLFPLTPEQVMMLPDPATCHCWWLGLQPTRSLNGISFSSPPLAVLQEDAGAKRALWRQINNYELHITAAAV